MKTQTVQAKVERPTHTIDASGKVLGRLASEIVNILMGKHKVSYSMHQDSGDYVLVKNVATMKITGSKLTSKEYMHFSQYPGGLKRSQLGKEMEKKPSRVLRRAVERMLPRNRLRPLRVKRLIIEGESGSKRIW